VRKPPNQGSIFCIIKISYFLVFFSFKERFFISIESNFQHRCLTTEPPSPRPLSKVIERARNNNAPTDVYSFLLKITISTV
jgi:hypothetical protein